MNRTKKAAPVDQTEGGNGEQIVMDGFVIPGADFTTGRTELQRISDFLMHGSVNAVPLRELELMTGLDGRTIRRMIQVERKDGSCICVNNMDGYFLAATETEREMCVRSMRHRGLEVIRTAQAIAAAEVGQ